MYGFLKLLSSLPLSALGDKGSKDHQDGEGITVWVLGSLNTVGEFVVSSVVSGFVSENTTNCLL